MRVAVVGGGPAGLYLGVLARRDPAAGFDVTVYERNRPDDVFGFGVVFSDATLGELAAADPESYAEIAAAFVHWDDIAVHHRGQVMRSTGHGFCGIERKVLLGILQRRAAALGVRVLYQAEAPALAELAGYDLVVAADGVASGVRGQLADALGATVTTAPNRFVWLGCTRQLDAFTFLFHDTPHGLLRVHAYPYAPGRSTFIVECRAATWQALGFDRLDEVATIAALEARFAADLAGARLVANRSIWRSFPRVRCARWSVGTTVLVGDAAHTAHFSIGSGTKLAMEDCVALHAALAEGGGVATALAAYEAARRPAVEALQAAASISETWFEETELDAGLPMPHFAYCLMTRSLRVSHRSMHRRDPALATAAQVRVAAEAGGNPALPPIEQPWRRGDRAFVSRLAWLGRERLDDEALVAGWHVVDGREPSRIDAVRTLDTQRCRPATGLDSALLVRVRGAAAVGPLVAGWSARGAVAALAGFVVELVPDDFASLAWLREAVPGALLVVALDARDVAATGAERLALLDAAVDACVDRGVDALWFDSALIGGGPCDHVLASHRARRRCGVATVVELDPGARLDPDALIAADRATMVALREPPRRS